METKPETIPITNFGGRLTRIVNGDLNSGFAKFNPSFGYDPFTKPMNLTWLEKASDITGPIANMPLAAATSLSSNNLFVYLIDQSKKLYQIQTTSGSSPTVDSVVGIGSVANGTGYLFGASMSFFGSVVGGYASDPFLYVSHDSGLNKIMTNGAAEATVIAGSNKLYPNSFHALKPFIGKLMIGNGNTVAAVDSTGTAVSSVIATGNGNYYSEFNPPLVVTDKVQDLDVSVDGNYLLTTSSQIPTERLDAVANDGANTARADSNLYRWNGTDATITSATRIGSFGATAQQTYLGQSMVFADDSFGAVISNGQEKLLTLPNNKSPLPNATDINGNFLTWAAPEVNGSTRYMSLYYYGALDAENPKGLYRVLRWATTQSNAQIFQVPLCMLVNSSYKTLNTSYAITTTGYGKHYIGLTSVNTSGTYQSFLLRFLITPTGSSTPQLGVYETQTQLFSKRMDMSQIRVYTEPVVAGNGFQIDLIGSDGNPITNGTFTYSFGDPIDKSERINFNPSMQSFYALGVRITNTGTTNMTIKKIELDVKESGK
jgi:hypothetical protein